MKQSKWPVARFDDILERVERHIVLDDVKTYDCVGVRWYGLGAFIRESKLGMNIRRKKQWIIKEGDVVYNKLFAWKGSFAIANAKVDGCIVSDKFPTYRLDEERVDLRYLHYYFRTEFIAQQAQDLSKGAAAISKLTLNPPDFWKLTIPLPPLDEQRRIVAHIEELAALIEEAQGLRVKAHDEVEVLLSTALARVFARADEEGWARKKLNKVAPVNMGQSPPGDTYNREGEGLPLLNGPTEFGTKHPEPVQWTRDPTKVCNPGDILICVRGATTGRMNWADQVYCIGRGLAALTVDQSQCLPEYVYYFLQHQTRIILDEARGSTFPNLPGRKLKAFPIPVPPLDEQRCIVAYLDGLQAQVDELTALQDATQAELDALLLSVLDQAFRGEL